MIHIIKGDLFTTDADVICHQVNCQGVMGSGVAKQVKEKYPKAYKEYKEICRHAFCCNDENYPFKIFNLLGYVQIVETQDKIIANLFCQLNYGYNGKRYTNYEAIYEAFEFLNNQFEQNVTFAFPYKIGCDRGGGNWDIILKMMEVVFKNREIFIYKLK